MARPPHEFYSKAEEAVPWLDPSFRQLSLQAMALLYCLAHGPGNGRSAFGMTVGVHFGLPEEIAARLGKSIKAIKRALGELEAEGWIVVDETAGVIALPPLVQGADNAFHAARVVNRCRAKLPDGRAARVYLEGYVARQRAAAANWSDPQREALEDLVRELESSYPGFLAGASAASSGDGASHPVQYDDAHGAGHRAADSVLHGPPYTGDVRRPDKIEEDSEEG